MFHTVLLKIYSSNQIVKEKGENGLQRFKEYDLEIKQTKLVKGQGLAKLLAESNSRSLEINLLDQMPPDVQIVLFRIFHYK